MAESAAAKVLDAQAARWKAAIPEGAERLNWLLCQSQETVLAMLAYCTAVSVDLLPRRAQSEPQGGVVASALQLDVANWWTVGVDNFLTHVAKAKIVAVVTEARGAEAASAIPAMKKAEACATAARLLLDSRWLPRPMRLVGPTARSVVAAKGTSETGGEPSVVDPSQVSAA